MPAETAEVILSAQGAADFLGIKPRTLQRWVKDRGVPHAKVGGLLRFRQSALVTWLAEQEQRTMEGRRHE